MTFNIKKITAAVLLCAVAASVSACTENKPQTSTTGASESAETTTAAETTATETTTPVETTATEAETTTVTAAEPQTSEGSTDKTHPFDLGVWLAKNEESEVEYYDETYYCFREGGSGSSRCQSIGIGVGFSYEMEENNPLDGVFHMGSADSNVKIEIVGIEVNKVRVKWENSNAVETWYYLGPDDDFSFFTNTSLAEMAKYYYGVYIDGTAPVEADASIRPDGLIAINLFNPEKTGDSTYTWFYIDRYTAKGHDMDGTEIDLTAFEGEWDEMPYAERFAPCEDVPERHTLLDNGEMLGFWYMGYIPSYANNYDNFREVYQHLFEYTGMIKKLRLLKNFPSDRFVTTGDGQELYYILPADEKGTLTVTKLVLDSDTAALKKDEVLYSSETFSAPILLQCNVSEIIPDVLITLTDRSGNTVEWSPSISGESGEVMTKNDSGAKIHDFTDYSNLMNPDNILQGEG